ncbi:hypothetical protein fHyEco03_gp59 [Escherichia phage vB_EcoM_fHy-Eco03]|nr:hypothetical protein fHyEco03_gp59 [Escherichia phage vB_EcoM_fHy-Eco03]
MNVALSVALWHFLFDILAGWQVIHNNSGAEASHLMQFESAR